MTALVDRIKRLKGISPMRINEFATELNWNTAITQASPAETKGSLELVVEGPASSVNDNKVNSDPTSCEFDPGDIGHVSFEFEPVLAVTVVVLPVGLGFNDFLRLKLWFSFEFGLIPEVLLDLPVGSFVLSQIRSFAATAEGSPAGFSRGPMTVFLWVFKQGVSSVVQPVFSGLFGAAAIQLFETEIFAMVFSSSFGEDAFCSSCLSEDLGAASENRREQRRPSSAEVSLSKEEMETENVRASVADVAKDVQFAGTSAALSVPLLQAAVFQPYDSIVASNVTQPHSSAKSSNQYHGPASDQFNALPLCSALAKSENLPCSKEAIKQPPYKNHEFLSFSIQGSTFLPLGVLGGSFSAGLFSGPRVCISIMGEGQWSTPGINHTVFGKSANFTRQGASGGGL
ncbi:hypothetical protein U1Q18_014526 [Sarracenia purpurea var. burkii]